MACLRPFQHKARILAWQLKCFWLRTEMIRDQARDSQFSCSPLNQFHFNSAAIRSPQACYLSITLFFFFFFLDQSTFLRSALYYLNVVASSSTLFISYHPSGIFLLHCYKTISRTSWTKVTNKDPLVYNADSFLSESTSFEDHPFSFQRLS